MQRAHVVVVPVLVSTSTDECEVTLVLGEELCTAAPDDQGLLLPTNSPNKPTVVKSSKFIPSSSRRCACQAVVLVGLALLIGSLLVMEMRMLPHAINAPQKCSPPILDTSNMEYHSNNRFNAMMKTINAFPAPSFGGEHAALCDDTDREKRKYRYCLPISGRKDSEFCSGADRMDLLLRQSPTTRCFASTLHLLLVDVYEELQAQGYSPILAFGSLLGAVRNGSMIPFTEDSDLAYSGEIATGNELDVALSKKGYHLFFLDIWRVCVAPTHPLASNLYDPDGRNDNYAVPYLDLYARKKVNKGSAYSMEGIHGRTLPSYRVDPFSQVGINGMSFNTVHDPDYFLLEEYGPEFMKPKARIQ